MDFPIPFPKELQHVAPWLMFALGVLVPPVVRAVRNWRKSELEIAEAALARALKTPDPKDDAEAAKKLDATKRINALVEGVLQSKASK